MPIAQFETTGLGWRGVNGFWFAGRRSSGELRKCRGVAQNPAQALPKQVSCKLQQKLFAINII